MTQAVPASYQANPVLRRPQSLPATEKEPALILERMVSITLSHDFDEATLPDECKPICDFVDQSLAMKLQRPLSGTLARRGNWPWSGPISAMKATCCIVSTPDRMNFGEVTDRTLISDNAPDISKSCSLYQERF